MELTDDDVREILRIVAETPLAELSVETAGFTLYVRRTGAGGVESSVAPGRRQGTPEDSSPPSSVPPARDVAGSTDQLGDASRNGLVTIEAPMLGTFYRAEGPGRKPFVEVGATVEPDSTVCIIEVMKMMNSIPAGVAGTIVEVCQENAQLVEYGQPLFRVQPA